MKDIIETFPLFAKRVIANGARELRFSRDHEIVYGDLASPLMRVIDVVAFGDSLVDVLADFFLQVATNDRPEDVILWRDLPEIIVDSEFSTNTDKYYAKARYMLPSKEASK